MYLLSYHTSLPAWANSLTTRTLLPSGEMVASVAAAPRGWARLRAGLEAIEPLSVSSPRRASRTAGPRSPSQQAEQAGVPVTESPRRSSDSELEQALLRTRAFVALLRCTGVRSVTGVTLRLDQVTGAGKRRGAASETHVAQVRLGAERGEAGARVHYTRTQPSRTRARGGGTGTAASETSETSEAIGAGSAWATATLC